MEHYKGELLPPVKRAIPKAGAAFRRVGFVFVAISSSKALIDDETVEQVTKKTQGRYRNAAPSADVSDFTFKVKSWACVPDTRLSIRTPCYTNIRKSPFFFVGGSRTCE